MTKPFRFEELLARIRVRLRPDASAPTTEITVGELRLDLHARTSPSCSPPSQRMPGPAPFATNISTNTANRRQRPCRRQGSDPPPSPAQAQDCSWHTSGCARILRQDLGRSLRGRPSLV